MGERRVVSSANYAQNHAQVPLRRDINFKSNAGFCMSPTACSPVTLASPSTGIPSMLRARTKENPPLDPSICNGGVQACLPASLVILGTVTPCVSLQPSHLFAEAGGDPGRENKELLTLLQIKHTPFLGVRLSVLSVHKTSCISLTPVPSEALGRQFKDSLQL